ncbi:peptide-N-glycosidase F-related protein [Candidatus Marinimicrobia bacterium]|nr:peptide-N-glycosidase F-related protein [Candidatus Neomarinimicrobiota bacterium]
MKKNIFILFFLQHTYLLSDTTVVAFYNEHQSFGNSGNNRVVIDTIQFPNSNSDFSEIIMNVSLECPNGGCDPWDRNAQISVMNLNDWYEIGRYVTPYGIGCGWSMDVTDYRSFLQGSVVLKSYIDTWVEPGWLVNINFEFISGIPEHPYVNIRKVWNYSNLVYGDNTNPVDIPSFSGLIPSDTYNAFLRMNTSGHGQGNTDNAAEFSFKLHDIYVNQEPAFVHNFWRSDCEDNPCSPQNGSWLYDRAGFCPGDKVTPQDFNLLEHSTPGDMIQLDYILEEYFNACSPNNPSCVDGITCTDCDYNYNGHTQPFYFIESQLILRTGTPHSNADATFMIESQDSTNGGLNIYLENYVPIYGFQFKLDFENQENLNVSGFSFSGTTGGRAESSGWTVSINDSGLVVGLSQFFGSPIDPGEGLLTQISYTNENNSQFSGIINISDLQVSGYFGATLTHEIGQPHSFQTGLTIEENQLIPISHSLLVAYPNPFNPILQIPFELSQRDKIDLNIYDVNGRMIKSLLYDKTMDAGTYKMTWNANSNPSGVYFIMINAGTYNQTRKVILIK